MTPLVRAIFLLQQWRPHSSANDILAALGDDTVTPRDLSDALRVYVRNPRYLKAQATDADRIDVNGMPAGKVTAEQANIAKLRRKCW